MGKLWWTNTILCGTPKIVSNSLQILGDVVMNSTSNHISPSKSASLMRGKTFRSQILCIVFLVRFLLILCHDDIFSHQEDWLPTHWIKTSKGLFFESMCREVCWFRLHTSGDLTLSSQFFVASWSFTLQGTRKTWDPPNGFQPEHRLEMVDMNSFGRGVGGDPHSQNPSDYH